MKYYTCQAKRVANSRDANAVFAKKFRPSEDRVKKHQQPCKHFASGMCKRGFNCDLKHDGTVDDWRRIPCKRPTYYTGFCDAGTACAYGHGQF